ncbi:MAG: hypothetical protein KDD82_08860 [Planctomycetes bacterium]|nr:hypothetical protein [Planctomycetota bacterium]
MARKNSGSNRSVGKGTGRHSKGRSTGRAKSISGKGKSVSGRSKSATGKSKAVKAAAPRKRGAASPFPVVCSECFSEYEFDPGLAAESIECPSCGHVASRPEDGALSHAADKARAEKSGFMLNFLFLIVGLVSFFAWTVLMFNPENYKDDTMFWAPLGVSLLCALLLAIFTIKYEGNRWETYF